MQIKSLCIRNFKSIRELEITDIEKALILVGKNNTGKTVVLDAIRAVTRDYEVKPTDFNEKKQKIEIKMVLEVLDDDLRQLHGHGRVSSFKRYDAWKKEFCEKIPSFSEGELSFVCTINHNGKIRYDDGIHKNNRYIPEILPKLYFIDTTRNLVSFQDDMLLFQNSEELGHLRTNTCIFDTAKNCKHCFSCIGLINQKKPEELLISETARLLEYKMYQLNLNELSRKVNDNYRKNGGVEEIQYTLSCNMENMFSVESNAWHAESKRLSPVEQLGNGMKSIYMLSLLETYIEDEKSIPSIIIVSLI